MRAIPAWTGRPGYDPRDLLKLYAWGYFNEVRSSRRLERACPAGRTLVRKQLHRKKRNITYVSQDCSGCALKPRRTTADQRFIKRHLDDGALNRMDACATPEMMKARQCAVEHPFGTIKRMTAGGRFLTRNLKGTRTEMALSDLAYSILRAVNIQTAIA